MMFIRLMLIRIIIGKKSRLEYRRDLCLEYSEARFLAKPLHEC